MPGCTSIRNLAVIAHVDHGKTTLINNMLAQTVFSGKQSTIGDRIMDSGDLEKEKGITILAKCTSIFYDNLKINVVDTPGHNEFGGEVERVLSMVDGVILLVDSSEGVMPQTKYVLSKALSLRLKVIVMINKVDRSDERCAEVLDEIYDLFLILCSDEKQLEFEVLYSVGRDGWAVKTYEEAKYIIEKRRNNEVVGDLKPLFDLIRDYFPEPRVDVDAPFKMLTTILTSDKFLGKILIGKVYSGVAKINSQVAVLSLNCVLKETTKLTKLFSFRGIERVPIDSVVAGDIVAVAGVKSAFVSDTICDVTVSSPIETKPIDPPTMSITIGVNDSPFAGRDGKYVTSKAILERLQREAETNVSITLTVDPKSEHFEVGGRGELQLGVLIEQMRREGFEMSIGRPKILLKKDSATGADLEPIEEVIIDVEEQYSSCVIQKMLQRKGELEDTKNFGNRLKMVFHVPSRFLIGYQREFMNDTHGNGIMNRAFLRYEHFKDCKVLKQRNGVIVSLQEGETTAYALGGLTDRGVFFVKEGVKVYKGMIIGETKTDRDLFVNPVKGKELTNMRSATSEKKVSLPTFRKIELEEMISYILDDEVVEVTPLNIRLRKKVVKL